MTTRWNNARILFYDARGLSDVSVHRTHSQRSSPAFDPLVRKANDVAAGAVLLTAIATAVIGAIVF